MLRLKNRQNGKKWLNLTALGAINMLADNNIACGKVSVFASFYFGKKRR